MPGFKKYGRLSMDNQCAACKAIIEGGEDACLRLYREFAEHAQSSVTLGRLRDVVFDAYCLQHIERYCSSAKSFFAHISRLCCDVEYNQSQNVYASINRKLNGKVELKKPAIPENTGFVTIVDIMNEKTDEAQLIRVREFIYSVWKAYESLQPLARRFIEG
jgi:hypothetical protein